MNVPIHTYAPSTADISFKWSLGSGTPSFITLTNPTPGTYKVRVQTDNPLHTGVYPIKLTLTEELSLISQTNSFTVTVSCVRKITPSTISAVEYWITDSKIPVTIPKFSLEPSTCPYELAVTAVALSSGDSLPSAISFDGTNTINVFESTHSKTGVYSVRVTVKDPKT